MITFARAAISRIAVYISSARDQRMAQPVPPPVIGCQPGETDHGLSGSSSRDGHRRFISSTNRAISGPSGGSGSSAPVTNRCSSASSSWRTSQTVLGPEGGNASRSKLTHPSSLLSFPNRRQVAPAWKASGPATLARPSCRFGREIVSSAGLGLRAVLAGGQYRWDGDRAGLRARRAEPARCCPATATRVCTRRLRALCQRTVADAGRLGGITMVTAAAVRCG